MKETFRHGRPFIKSEEAHLNIGFSCIAYLNTSFRLLPQHSNAEERRLWVLQGLHGLQIYANQFWHQHILAYMDSAMAQQLEIPEHLVEQLKEILKYSKAKPSVDLTQPAIVGASKGKNPPTQRYLSLKQLPGLDKLVLDLEVFRSGLKNRDWTQKSIEGKHFFLTLRGTMLI
jgi:hypothetical protein